MWEWRDIVINPRGMDMHDSEIDELYAQDLERRAQAAAIQQEKRQVNWAVAGGWLLAAAVMMGFWWFFIWAGTRLWKP